MFHDYSLKSLLLINRACHTS